MKEKTCHTCGNRTNLTVEEWWNSINESQLISGAYQETSWVNLTAHARSELREIFPMFNHEDDEDEV